jgi:hypothetical protein
MNKEFKKLLEQSYTKGFEECARTGHKVGDLDVIFNSIVMGEFAELIVRECADYFDREGDHRFEVDGNWIAKTIKQHFGVEE